MITDSVKLGPTLTLFRYDNSERYYARFKLKGRWITRTTGTTDYKEAIELAKELAVEQRVLQKHGVVEHTPRNKQFIRIADKAIERMELMLDVNEGKQMFTHYIGALNKYHKPFFGSIAIDKITQQSLREFDDWRAKTMHRMPARSTIQNHNAALQRVFEEAVEHNLMAALEVPQLRNNGAAGSRRASFTEDEIQVIRSAAAKWVKQGKKEITRSIRAMLVFYIDVALGTMMRPGKEIEHITVGDVHVRSINGDEYATITVRKGKTTLFTGTREVVVRDEAVPALKHLLKLHKNKPDSTLLFDVGTAVSTNPFGKNFQRLLKRLELEYDAHGKRTLYSLRHTAITKALLEGVAPNIVAKNAGHSLEMLERHYSHIQPQMFAAQLAGRK